MAAIWNSNEQIIFGKTSNNNDKSICFSQFEIKTKYMYLFSTYTAFSPGRWDGVGICSYTREVIVKSAEYVSDLDADNKPPPLLLPLLLNSNSENHSEIYVPLSWTVNILIQNVGGMLNSHFVLSGQNILYLNSPSDWTALHIERGRRDVIEWLNQSVSWMGPIGWGPS